MTVYLVEAFDEGDSATGQLGGFTTPRGSRTLYRAAGVRGSSWDLRVNMLEINQRLQDWLHDTGRGIETG